jgi:hypothetical protein
VKKFTGKKIFALKIIPAKKQKIRRKRKWIH